VEEPTGSLTVVGFLAGWWLFYVTIPRLLFGASVFGMHWREARAYRVLATAVTLAGYGAYLLVDRLA
jgi:hypothetical protein